ncbi:PaaI family thioesterase [Gleimia sp. 6138-11-ORH1]|uniref:PaaI family thioesterase n=1 Tax=Gleimia sp. 6138-11-ORH1 TaxID=2973937 RepID=UPI0021686931|nr:PaaI family thioesterase [Gleimia sp. 6138-11-ORH1]MCS4484297.1 PaaI family thioesterase [Gleimia sp. 6138-11-ORH1]
MSDIFSFSPDSLMSRMGMRIVEVSAQKTVLEMPVAGNLQPAGFLHGGGAAALAETAGSLASLAYAQQLRDADGQERTPVGTDLSISHLRPGSGAAVTAVAVAVKLGRTRCVHQVQIFSEDGKLISTAMLGNQLV